VPMPTKYTNLAIERRDDRRLHGAKGSDTRQALHSPQYGPQRHEYNGEGNIMAVQTNREEYKHSQDGYQNDLSASWQRGDQRGATAMSTAMSTAA
jgi:hypothetical protein